MSLETVRRINLAVSGVGAAIFAALALYLVLAPDDFDQRTRAFALAKVEGRVDETLSLAANSETADRLTSLAGRFSERLGERAETLRAGLDAGMDQFIADVLAAACELDCERREEARRAVRLFYEAVLERYGEGLDRIERFIVGEYQDVMDELRGDLTLFSTTNFLALAFAFGLSVFRGRAAIHLAPAAAALTVSTVLAVLWYAFGQDWVMTIVFSDYWGWGYVAAMSVLFLWMLDIAANRARVTTTILNAIGSLSPGGVSLSPC